MHTLGTMRILTSTTEMHAKLAANIFETFRGGNSEYSDALTVHYNALADIASEDFSKIRKLLTEDCMGFAMLGNITEEAKDDDVLFIDDGDGNLLGRIPFFEIL